MAFRLSCFTDEKSPFSHEILSSLQVKLSEVWKQGYEELYESDTERTNSLQIVLEEILVLLQDGDQIFGHIRYVWMAVILASSVKPTVDYYQPTNSIPEEVISQMALWLVETIKAAINPETAYVEIIGFKNINALSSISNLFSDIDNIAAFQVIYEALNIYSHAINTLDYNQSSKALVDILNDCLLGYAIFPGSHGRRELFDWWLLDVVPASWSLLPPSSIYVINELPNREEIISCQRETLEQISSGIWFILLENDKNREKIKSIFSKS
ncbi:MAG: hypothetical protein KME64_29975 [Scytonematopsis contorta HA4267-MV1]|jgi:hypothetical protein|nr:hypothetical protein [Scytonematopsis contorta HA4267-MV1]